MKLNKKSQITMLMILGLTLLITVSLILYISKFSVKKSSQRNIERTQLTPIKIQPIKEFITKCLDKLAKDAFVLIGKQGGYIYKSQNGMLIDYRDTDEGLFFVKYNNYNVAYDILPPKFEVLAYSSQAPIYPWITFPYKTASSNEEIFEGYFGISNLPPLNYSEGPNSVQTQIETYIDNNMAACLDFTIFEEQGFEITINSTNTSIIIGRNDVTIKSKIPITIENPTTNQFTKLDDFSINLDLRLRDIYFFVKDLIDKDIKDIKFDIKELKSDKELSIKLIENVFSNDDLIIITDKKSLIEGKTYQYIFPRKNRAPALHYIKKTTLEFPQGYEIKLKDILQDTELKADDPDEDNLTFSVEPQLPYVLNVPQKNFKIEVGDSEFSDYQIITVNRI